MPRHARYFDEAPYYHVMMQGINKNYILMSSDFKFLFLKLLEKYTVEHNVTTIAYCIMGNHVHLLLKSKSINDLSECIKRINTTFAMRYNKINNRVGYVFRNRFRMEPIYEQHHLHNCIKYIHMNPVKAGIVKTQVDYPFSSYRSYFNKSWFRDKELYQEIFHIDEEYEKVISDNAVENTFIDEEFSLEEAKEWLEEFLKGEQINYSDIYTKKDILEYVVINLKNECKLKNVKISKLINIGESKISRILNNKN